MSLLLLRPSRPPRSEPVTNPLKPPTQQQPDFEPEMPITPRQARILGLFILWLLVAGMWQTAETVIGLVRLILKSF